MKKYLAIAALLWCTAGSAQPTNNPIFFGGKEDGSSTGQNTPVSAANQAGGTGGGAGGGTSSAQFASNQKGGSADGSALAANTPVNAVTNGGGNGSGWSLAANTPVIPVNNTGGNGDGWNTDVKAAPLPVTNAGGTGDGWSGIATTAVTPTNQRGGSGDGWNGANFTGPFTPPVPLPQQFLSFTAKKQDADALLDWKMGNEKGVDRYIVERSSNAVTFSRIGEVTQQEAARAHYSFVDESPLPGHNYYRIRVMAGGEEKLTPVRLLVFEEVRPAIAMTLYPNPATTRITVALPGAWLGANTVLNVYSASGTLVLQQKLVPLSTAQVVLPVEALAPGVYTLQAATDVESLRAPFVKR